MWHDLGEVEGTAETGEGLLTIRVIELVVEVQQRLELEVAEAVANEANEVNTEDDAIVKRGLTEEDAQIICGGLRKWTRLDGIRPGVICEPVHDV